MQCIHQCKNPSIIDEIDNEIIVDTLEQTWSSTDEEDNGNSLFAILASHNNKKDYMNQHQMPITPRKTNIKELDNLFKHNNTNINL